MPKKIADLEEKIIREARRLFETRGYSGVDVKEIARAAGTVPGNLYNYFSSKQDLFYHTAELWQEQLCRDLDAVASQPVSSRERLEEALLYIYNHVEKHWGVWRSFMDDRSAPEQYRKMQPVMKRVEQKNIKLITALIKELEAETDDPSLAGFEEYWARTLILAHAFLPASDQGTDRDNRRFLAHLLTTILPQKEGAFNHD